MSAAKPSKGGLEGISVGKTAISTIDGTLGKLWYRGYDIADLAENASYEETVYLLWNGELPDWKELANETIATKHRNIDTSASALPCRPAVTTAP